MGEGEFSAMTKTGMVQESFTGTTHVAFPANPSTFMSQAKSGALYVEFGVPRSSVIETGTNGFAKIIGPSSLEGRNALRFGRPVPQMPPASNPFCSICRTGIQ
jgi:hypothetical protein